MINITKCIRCLLRFESWQYQQISNNRNITANMPDYSISIEIYTRYVAPCFSTLCFYKNSYISLFIWIHVIHIHKGWIVCVWAVVVLPPLGQSLDCPSDNELTLDLSSSKINRHQIITEHNKARTVYIIPAWVVLRITAPPLPTRFKWHHDMDN